MNPDLTNFDNILLCLQCGAAWIHDKGAEDLTLADLLVKHEVDPAPLSIGGKAFGAANHADFPFESRGDAKKGSAGVKINGKPVGNMPLDTKVADLLVPVEGGPDNPPWARLLGWKIAFVSFGKKFRSVVVV